MKKHMGKSWKLVVMLASLWGLGFAEGAWALFDAQAFLGMQSGSLQDSKIGSKDLSMSGNHLGVAAHLDPIPLVPLAFGLGISMPSLKGKDSASNEFTLNGMLVDLEAMAWVPIDLFGFTPYAKLGYIVSGAYKGDHTIKNRVTMSGVEIDPTVSGEQKYSYALKSSGYKIALGLQYSLIPLVKLLLELSSQSETLAVSTVKVGGGDLGSSTFSDMTLVATDILLGVQVGL